MKYDSIRNYIEEYLFFQNLVNNFVDVLNETVYFEEYFNLLFDDYYKQHYIEILQKQFKKNKLIIFTLV